MRNNFLPISDYSYELPDDRIAKYPLDDRKNSKLLIYKGGNIEEDRFYSLTNHLPENSCLFFNNTRVIHARLQFKKKTGARIEIFCLQPIEPVDYQLALSETQTCTWLCMVGNLKKWKDEDLTMSLTINGLNTELRAKKIQQDAQGVRVTFSWDQEITFADLIQEAGIIPIPPYLNRDSEDLDHHRYQTVYSRFDGSVAAPTAGLHFTPEILKKVESKGIQLSEVTLHVGAGTFQPVKDQNIFEHKMHSEHFSVPASMLAMLANADKTIIATGTTTMRTLESLYWLAVKSLESGKLCHRLSQWEYNNLPQDYPIGRLFSKFHMMVMEQDLDEFKAETGIMITPGYKFRLVEALITNYHQPKSTLLLLIAAFIGEDWKKVYQHALDNDFRFLSYGDSSLLWKSSTTS